MKMTLIALITAVGTSAFAATQQNYCGTEMITQSNCKNIPSNRRDELGHQVSGGNPVAITNQDGNLMVHYTVGGSKLKACQITNNAKSFKMSQNTNDISTAYYLKDDGDLFDVKMQGSVSTSECPKASKQNYSADLGISRSDDVVEFKLASNSRNSVTMAARTRAHYVIYSTDTRIFKKGPYRSADRAEDEMRDLLNN